MIAPSLRLSLRATLALVLVAHGCGDDAGPTAPEPEPIPQPTGGFGGSSFGDGRDASSPWAGREVGSSPTPVPADASTIDTPPPDPAQFNCPEVPTAWVYDFVDPHTGNQGTARELLTAAGFDVQSLPLDRDPT